MACSAEEMAMVASDDMKQKKNTTNSNYYQLWHSSNDGRWYKTLAATLDLYTGDYFISKRWIERVKRVNKVCLERGGWRKVKKV